MSDDIPALYTFEELLYAFPAYYSISDSKALPEWYEESNRKGHFNQIFSADADDATKLAYVVALFKIYSRNHSVGTEYSKHDSSFTTAIPAAGHRGSYPVVYKQRHCVRCHMGYDRSENTPGSCQIPHVILHGSGQEVNAPDYARALTLAYQPLCCQDHLIRQTIPKRKDMCVEWRGVSQPCFNGRHTTDMSKVLYNFASVVPCQHPKGMTGSCDVDAMLFYGQGHGPECIKADDESHASMVRYHTFRVFFDLEIEAREFIPAYKQSLLGTELQALLDDNSITL